MVLVAQLNATELFTLKALTLCYVNVTLIHFKNGLQEVFAEIKMLTLKCKMNNAFRGRKELK